MTGNVERSKQVISTRHVLAVNDLDTSTDYYINVLGFERDFAVDGWEFLSFGSFRVMLGECKEEVPASATNNHSYFAYVLVTDIDSIYAAAKTNGAEFTQRVADKPWGLREFGVVTPDGHRIMYGQEIAQ